MFSKPHVIRRRSYPGASQKEIAEEPEWGGYYQARIGFFNRQNRLLGLTHRGDEKEQEDKAFEREALEEIKQLRDRVLKGGLINFRDAITKQRDFHLRRPDVHSAGWRYVLDTSEDWIKNVEEWPANLQRKKKEEAQKEAQKPRDDEQSRHDEPKQEADVNRSSGPTKHHDAYVGDFNDDEGLQRKKDVKSEEEGENEYDKLRKKYTPQEIALLRMLQHEKEYVYNLKQDDGKKRSPLADEEQLVSIDEVDQFTPDNWIPRSQSLIRLTGKHPLNAEPQLTSLFDAGLITPNALHFVRNHGPVPHLLWETHILEVDGIRLRLTMDELKNDFEPINIPVALACDGNRRKELNMLKRSKGYNWGAGAVSCAYWKGPLLRDILLAAGMPEKFADGKRYWVNFEGADELSEGAYATCIPFDYAMDPINDVILAYEMNNVPLPPDHGHPIRVIIPGYVGGRCVKWLSKIWLSDKENDSHYHIWDNRVLPSFITETDGEFANTMFTHPDTACNEQNINSVIFKPAHGEKIPLTEARKGKSYRIEGYAYDGGGHEIQRVEVSLDQGETWLYCVRKFPNTPIRHGNKYWTWLYWHVEVEIMHLLRAKSVTVRCHNVFKNTQPERPSWNIMGMMNNCWYTVKPEIRQDSDNSVPEITFYHPVEPATGTGGWLKESAELQISNARQTRTESKKQFTREEIEKHSNEHDCWIVVDEKVYDATSVLEWHPGGKAAVMGHAGKVHQDTTDDFGSIHDSYAYEKLNECLLGAVTEKCKGFIKISAKKNAEDRARASKDEKNLALHKHRWVPVRLRRREIISHDTRRYIFDLPTGRKTLGLTTGQHIQLGFHFKDKMVIRPYTPIRPIFHSEEDGTFQLVVKTYFPDDNQPGGAMSNILDCMPIGEEVEIRGPMGEIIYDDKGKFTLEGNEQQFKRISLILGGTGITPGYQLVRRILKSDGDTTEIRVIDANNSESDILLREEWDELQKEHAEQFKIVHVLAHHDEDWKGLSGFVTAAIIKEHAFPSTEENVVFVCGPPMMIQKAVMPALKDWGYQEGLNCFGF